MRRFFVLLAWLFGIAYVMAFAVGIIGLFGLFGVAADPLAGVFLIPLGLPWVLISDLLPVILQPYAALLAPLINLAILIRLGKPRKISKTD